MPKKKARHVHDWRIVIPAPPEFTIVNLNVPDRIAWCKKCGVLRFKDGRVNMVYLRPNGDA